MTTADNKRLMQHLYAELAVGNRVPFREAMSEDFTWTINGSGAWSRSFHGRDAVRKELFEPLFAQFATDYRSTADAFIAEDDRVVVLCHGDVMTKSGDRYANSYCNVVRLRDGKMIELIEYMDTELAARVLSAPAMATT
jgi:uncharacterized protein